MSSSTTPRPPSSPQADTTSRHASHRHIAPIIAALVAAAGCKTQQITLHPAEIHRHVPELRRDGRARVEVDPRGFEEITLDRRLKVDFKACALFGLLCDDHRKELTVSELIASCPDVAPFREDRAGRRAHPACKLLATTSEAIPIGTRRTPDKEAILVGFLYLPVALVLMLGVGYLAECADPDDGC